MLCDTTEVSDRLHYFPCAITSVMLESYEKTWVVSKLGLVLTSSGILRETFCCLTWMGTYQIERQDRE